MLLNVFGARKIKAECWFCQQVNHLQPLDLPTSKQWGKRKEPLFALEGSRNNFHCEACGNWNLRDASGDIVSSLPAMYNPSMNTCSSSAVGQSRSPAGNGSKHITEAIPLCDRCRTNQVLIMNYIANYFPEDETDPRMQRLEQSYPEDMAAFERSFPPLCEMCAPKVEDVIKKKDYEAQINAWKMILQDAGQVSARTPNRVMPRTGSRHLERSIAAAWSIVTIAYPPYQLVSGSNSLLLDLLWVIVPFWYDPLQSMFWSLDVSGGSTTMYSSLFRYSQQSFGLSSILLHGLPHKILGSLLVLASYVATVRLLLDLRASSKAAQLRLARQNIQARGSGGIKHHNNPDGMSQRSQGPNDPFNLISLINNVSPAHGTKITSAHDPDQPRSSPMIQLSPSPEMEPLSMPNILPALNNSVDPDFMDWEATEPAVNSAINIGAQKATSAWDRFATTKQRIFVKDQLTGLERAFETWRDLGGNANSETTQHQATTPTVFKRVRARRRSVERAAYMLASVLRILSLALTWPTRARVLSAETGRESGTGFGIAASVVEAVIASPQIASSQNWGLQNCVSIIQICFAFCYVASRLPAVQIVLGQTAFANQDMLIDSVMAVLDIAAWTVS